MSDEFRICAEQPADGDAISEVTRMAFEDQPHSNHDEQTIIEGLRGAGALAVSLVARTHGKVVAHVAFFNVGSVK